VSNFSLKFRGVFKHPKHPPSYGLGYSYNSYLSATRESAAGNGEPDALIVRNHMLVALIATLIYFHHRLPWTVISFKFSLRTFAKQ